MDIKIVSGINLTRIVQDVNALNATHTPVGGLYYKDGLFFQALEEGVPTAPYSVIDVADDVSFIAAANAQDAQPLGEALLIRSRIIKAFGRSLATGDTVTASRAFRGMYTGNGTKQLITTADTPTPILINTAALASPDLGTLDTLTGEFTFTGDFEGMVTVSASVLWTGAAAAVWSCQLQLRPFGQPSFVDVDGANVRQSLVTGLTTLSGYSTAISLEMGDTIRFTQQASVTPGVGEELGIVANAAAFGVSQSPGFTLNLFSVT